MAHAARWLLVMLGAAPLGCAPFVAVTDDPGHCSREHTSPVIRTRLYGHAPLLADDYPKFLCDWDGALLSAGERRRMTRTTSHYHVAGEWAELGQRELAIAALRRDLAGATTLTARIVDRLEIAKLLSELSEHDAALRELDEAEEELGGKRSTQLLDARADVLAAAGRRREAIALLETRPAEEWWFGNAINQIRIGELWLEEREPTRARAAFEAALALAEGQRVGNEIHDAHVGLVRVVWLEGHPQQALDELDRLLDSIDQTHELSPHHAEAWRLRAELARTLDEPWIAAASIRRAFELEHLFAEPSELAQAGHKAELASLHLRAEQPDLALAGFEAAYRVFERELGPLHRRTLSAAHNLGVACMRLGDREQAVRWLRLAAKGDEAVGAGPFDLGVTLLQLGRAEQGAGLHAEAAASFAAALDLLSELDDPQLTDLDRADMHRDAARAFLDAAMCEQAVATIEIAKQFQVQLGEEPSYVNLVGTQPRLEQLRRCWGPNRPGFD